MNFMIQLSDALFLDLDDDDLDSANRASNVGPWA